MESDGSMHCQQKSKRLPIESIVIDAHHLINPFEPIVMLRCAIWFVKWQSLQQTDRKQLRGMSIFYVLKAQSLESFG
jgi:hypothetical protein